MSEPTILVSDDGHIRTITISRPKALNALNRAVLDELSRAVGDVAAAAKSGAVRVVVVTGAGEKAFVAGADIAEMKSMSASEARAFSALGNALFRSLATLDVPVIAAVNGFALGGGLELALACDFIWAADTAKLGLVETNLGLIPGFGGTVRLPRRVGAAIAAELIMSAATLKADEALRVGLVNRVVPAAELMNEVRKLANTIASKGPKANAIAKRLLLDDERAGFESAMTREIDAFGAVFDTTDHNEGIAAFLEKRAASFAGK
jgi:enoyl-CoA hydratase